MLSGAWKIAIQMCDDVSGAVDIGGVSGTGGAHSSYFCSFCLSHPHLLQ